MRLGKFRMQSYIYQWCIRCPDFGLPNYPNYWEIRFWCVRANNSIIFCPSCLNSPLNPWFTSFCMLQPQQADLHMLLIGWFGGDIHWEKRETSFGISLDNRNKKDQGWLNDKHLEVSISKGELAPRIMALVSHLSHFCNKMTWQKPLEEERDFFFFFGFQFQIFVAVKSGCQVWGSSQGYTTFTMKKQEGIKTAEVYMFYSAQGTVHRKAFQ